MQMHVTVSSVHGDQTITQSCSKLLELQQHIEGADLLSFYHTGTSISAFITGMTSCCHNSSKEHKSNTPPNYLCGD